MSRVALSLFILASLLLLGSTASAQIYYEPTQYQYSAGGTTYYYGGSDPRVHIVAAEPYSPSGTWGRAHGWAFFSGDVNVHREVANEPLRVFTDAFPLINAHIFHFTAADALNEANANAPRYFVKRDLLNTAVVRDGVWVVPAQAQPVRIYKSNGTLLDRGPATMPRPLMIIPKDSLQKLAPRPGGAGSNKTLASAK